MAHTKCSPKQNKNHVDSSQCHQSILLMGDPMHNLVIVTVSLLFAVTQPSLGNDRATVIRNNSDFTCTLELWCNVYLFFNTPINKIIINNQFFFKIYKICIQQIIIKKCLSYLISPISSYDKKKKKSPPSHLHHISHWCYIFGEPRIDDHRDLLSMSSPIPTTISKTQKSPSKKHINFGWVREDGGVTLKHRSKTGLVKSIVYDVTFFENLHIRNTSKHKSYCIWDNLRSRTSSLSPFTYLFVEPL